MNVKIKYGNISGTIIAPSSKSYTQRYMLYSAFSNKPVKIKNVSFSDDEVVSIKIAESCNASISYHKKDITIKPDFRPPDSIYVGESGTSYRLSLGLLAAKKCKTIIRGEQQLAERPVEPLINALSDAGTIFTKDKSGFFNLNGENSTTNSVHIDGNTSSQFVSALLFYYSIAGKGNFTVSNMVSENYVKITINCLSNFGVIVKNNGPSYSIENTDYLEKEIEIEGDYSSASYFMVLGIFTGNLKIKGLNVNSLQPDRQIVDLLNRATGCIEIHSNELEIIKANNIREIIIDASTTPDIAPIVSIIGIFSENGVKIFNYRRLKTKESDRWAGIVEMCRSFGASVSVYEEFISIKKGIVKEPEFIEFTDHRMIMSGIIAGIIGQTRTEYRNAEKINKSYPEFLVDLKRLGLEVDVDMELR
jgi:3-phosphoshikimate 1-carboxyvinyltransferase